MSLPDSEAMVVTFLQARAGVPVSTKVMRPRLDRFVRAWRSGGASTHPILDVPHITVTAWGVDATDASETASRCRSALLDEYTAMPLVRRVEEIGGLYYDPDPDTGIDRYTFTVQLRVRAPLR